MRGRILLVVEGDPTPCRTLNRLLTSRGFTVLKSDFSCDLPGTIRRAKIELAIIMTTRNSSFNGTNAISAIRRSDDQMAVILVASESSESLAIEALRAGATDYFREPFDVGELVGSAERQLCKRCTAQPGKSLGSKASQNTHRMIGSSQLMQGVRSYLARLANSPSNVLLTGETGTGKELAAEVIHQNSSRAQKPLVCINCAAIPDTLTESELFGYEKGAFTGATANKLGRLQQAHGGTVFLDEIGDMSPYSQAKILRVIESREIQPLGGRDSVPLDIRVIAATNHDLEELAAAGKFRQDLYFRLNVGRVHLPPLRERREDIPELLAYHIVELNSRLERRVEGVGSEVIDRLLKYDWPGNIRELRNVLEASFVNAQGISISLKDLPDYFRERLDSPGLFPQSEREHLLLALLSTNWNKSKAAEKLKWSRMTVYRKLTKYQITRSFE